jgi:hypothetical protein
MPHREGERMSNTTPNGQANKPTRGNASEANARLKQAAAERLGEQAAEQQAAAAAEQAILSLEELGDGEDWLAGPRPRPTPMLLTMDGGRGADDLGQIGFLPRGKVGLMVSPGGTGKTALLCQLALSVASGVQWLETFNVIRGPERVVLALGEEDREEIRLRLYDAANAMGIRTNPKLQAFVKKNLRVIPLYGRDAKILAPMVNDLGHMSDQAEPSAVAQQWMDQLKAEGETALIILDPLSRFIRGDENDNTNATEHVTILEKFTKLPGNPTVLCAHHANKNALNSDKAASQGDSRGASALVDGARWMSVLLKKTKEGERARVVFSVEKTNYTPPLEETIELVREDCWKRYRGPELPQEPATSATNTTSKRNGKATKNAVPNYLDEY